MIALNAHFDGKVIVPDEPLDLPANQKVRVELEPIDSENSSSESGGKKLKRILGEQRDLVLDLAPDWDAPLPDDFWDHNKDDNIKP